MSDSDSVEGDSSELGKHEHWQAVYQKELNNLQEFGDVGEIWFGEVVTGTMLDWTQDLLATRHGPGASKQLSILDIGTGNGVFLVELARRGFKRLIGSDYSAASVALCRAVAAQAGLGEIEFVEDDFLDSKLQDRYDVITDKGTLDAVGLMAEPEVHRQRYKQAVWELLKPGGLLVITSCNTTRQELLEELQAPGQGGKQLYRAVDHVRTYPTFRFGGQEGSRVCTVAFERLA